MEDTIVTVYELDKMPDGTLRIGNSIELPVEEAVMRVDQKTAKFPDYPIGVVPEEWA